MKYHINIIDGNVELPEDIDKEYTNFDICYETMREFVHSFDGIMQVNGRVVDENGDDIDYSSSIMD